ncbi:MAG: cohesin domain-containing protein, partial [candidate division KSB1 bacterium]|nr:cohesin domain-containing protein [candidate division KSB1 bacterium]
MRRLKCISVMVFILGVSPFAWSQIPVSLQDMTADSGQTITLPVTVSDLSGLNILSYQFQLTFDERVLEALAATSEGTLTAAWGVPLFNINQNGKIGVGGYGAHFLSGSGTLVNLHFKVIGNWGQSTPLVFESFIFNNGQPLAQTKGATFTVRLKPIKVMVTTNIGLPTSVLVDGRSRSVPFDTTWYPGTVHSIGITSPQAGGPGIRYNFLSWSDGGAPTHDIAPVTDTTFIATLSTEYYLDVISCRGNPRGEGWYRAGTIATFSVDSVVTGVEGTRYVFSSWTGTEAGAYTGPNATSSVTMQRPVTEMANWDTQFYLTVRTDPSELTIISGSGWYNKATTAITGAAPLTVATEDTIFRFTTWSVDGRPREGNPVSILMDTSHVATAHYNTHVSVTVTTSIGPGTQVIVDGNLENAPYTTLWLVGSFHTIDVPNIQSGGQGIRYLFSAWSDGQEKKHLVTPVSNTSYVAELTTQYYLTVQVNPAGLTYITGNGWYNKDTIVKLTATPEHGYRVEGWYDVNNILVSIAKTIEVVMDCNQIFTLRFEPAGTTSVGGGGNAIQMAIDTAKSGETLIILPGTYNGNITTRGKDITLVSTNPDDPNIVART